MPEQQPDKRCGTCKWYAKRTYRCFEHGGYYGPKHTCPAWTPKTPKNPEEK